MDFQARMLSTEMFYGRGAWFAEENEVYLDSRMDLNVEQTNPRKVSKTNGSIIGNRSCT